MVQILGLKNQDSSQLLLRFSIWPVGNRYLAALEPDGSCVPTPPERFTPQKVTALPQHVVICEASLDESLTLAIRHSAPPVFIQVSKAQVSHGFLPLSSDEIGCSHP